MSAEHNEILEALKHIPAWQVLNRYLDATEHEARKMVSMILTQPRESITIEEIDNTPIFPTASDECNWEGRIIKGPDSPEHAFKWS